MSFWQQYWPTMMNIVTVRSPCYPLLALLIVGADFLSRTQHIDTDDEAMACAIEESMLLQARSS